MKRGARGWALATAAAGLFGTAGCLGSDSPAAEDGIHIGALLPYTGDLAASGPSLERGITLAVEAANRAGGVAGRPLIIDVEDTHSSIDRGHASAERLFGRGIAALIGPEEPVLARELAPALGDERAVMISGGITARAEGGAEPSLWFRIFASAKSVTSELANRMMRDGRRTASVLYVDDSYGATFASFLQSKLASLGGQVVDSLPLPANISSLTFPNGPPKALVLIAYPGTGALAVQQMAATGYAGPWYFAPSLDSEEFVLNTPRGYLDGMVGISPALTADFTEFADLYQARFHLGAPSLGANFYYDSAAVLALALTEAHQHLGRLPDGAELAASVRSVSAPAGQTVTWRELESGLRAVADGVKVNYRGISGAIDFDTDGDVAQGLVRFWHVADGTIARE
ncbi:MAG TPA: ABC transporter substrate-binding protein [Polyangia bacterium]